MHNHQTKFDQGWSAINRRPAPQANAKGWSYTTAAIGANFILIATLPL